MVRASSQKPRKEQFLFAAVIASSTHVLVSVRAVSRAFVYLISPHSAWFDLHGLMFYTTTRSCDPAAARKQNQCGKKLILKGIGIEVVVAPE